MPLVAASSSRALWRFAEGTVAFQTDLKHASQGVPEIIRGPTVGSEVRPGEQLEVELPVCKSVVIAFQSDAASTAQCRSSYTPRRAR